MDALDNDPLRKAWMMKRNMSYQLIQEQDNVTMASRVSGSKTKVSKYPESQKCSASLFLKKNDPEGLPHSRHQDTHPSLFKTM